MKGRRWPVVLSDDLYLNMISSFGEKYQYDQVHAKAVEGLAVDLFERLMDVHKLGSLELNLLRHAALLHDVGLFISTKKHHKSSAYLIMIDRTLDGYPQVERRILALLARNHRKEIKLNGAELSQSKREAVLKLIAILRVADVLDYFHDGQAVIKDLQIDKNKCVITVEGISLADISKQLKDKAALFKELFRLKPIFAGNQDNPAEVEEAEAVQTPGASVIADLDDASGDPSDINDAPEEIVPLDEI